jgi:DNA polymerase (family 10)
VGKKTSKKVKSFSNKEVGHLLRSIAAAYEVKGESNFKITAYSRAADAVEHSTSEVKDLWDDKKLSSIPGIGASIASHLDELFRTGRVKHFGEVMRGLPPAMFELLEIPGIGPKRAHELCLKLGITRVHSAVSKLRKSAEQGEIRDFAGYGEESEKRILEGIREYSSRSGRVLLYKAAVLAEELVDYLKKIPEVKEAVPLGSLRRQVATVGDVDMAVASDEPEKVIKYFASYPRKVRLVEAGERTATIVVTGGHQIDLMVQPPESFGSLLQHFTGSKMHNIRLREIAMKKGLSLSEYGIRESKEKRAKSKEKGKLNKFKTEERFYGFLGMKWIPPELREDVGEIEASLADKLPKLVELEDIKGDLHVHSSFPIEPAHDEGGSSMKVMLARAGELGYEYLGFSEHNPSSDHSERQFIELLKGKREAIEKINSSGGEKGEKRVWAFNGLEVDIKADGSLVVPDKALEELDFVIASVHSSFRMNRRRMTGRVLKALEHPKVKILGHPTGRLLGEREGYELDWERVFDFCLKNDKWLEINAWPNRLDLPDTLVREAVKLGERLVINTDSHDVAHMEMMRWGVSVARRGWAEKKDIVNTSGVGKMKGMLGV